MVFMDFIIGFLEDARDWLHEAYLEVSSWPTPFNFLATQLYYIYVAFYYLVEYFGIFNDWLEWAAAWIGEILDWDSIWDLILGVIPNLETIRDWFYDWASNVANIVRAWWEDTSETVLGWIDAAVAFFQDIADAWYNFWNNLWPQFTRAFGDLASAWNYFWEIIFPSLVDFDWLTSWWAARLQDVGGLIDTAFSLRKSLWEGWQDLRDQVTEFIQDPAEFVWGKFVDWFLGPEG